MEKTVHLTCVVCPAGCPLEVTRGEDGAVLAVTGNTCPRGKTYAEAELTNPVRTLTTTVAIEGAEECRRPVNTHQPIPKADLFRAMEIAEGVTVQAPIRCGDIVVRDFIEEGTHLVACKTIEAE